MNEPNAISKSVNNNNNNNSGSHLKTPKDVGVCGVCWGSFKVQRSTGFIHRHGHRDNPCGGSDKPPASVSAAQPSPRLTQSQAATSVSAPLSQVPAPAVPSAPTPSDALSHPVWVKQIGRIPRAARQSCRSLLTQIIRKVIDDPNDKSAWNELLHFGPVILAKPKRGGANRNLSNIITKRTAAWGKDLLPVTREQRTHIRPGKDSTEDSKMAAAVTSKLEAGNFRAAIRIISSSDTPAPVNMETLQALQQKHPAAASDRRPPCDPAGNQRFEPLQVSKEDVLRALRSFPLGSSGGPDGLTPQHINDLLAGATDDSLQSAVVDLVNVLLAGSCCKEINTIVFGGRLIALTKKDGGIRPISVGYTLRRLAAKCANNYVIKRRSEALRPQQLGVGVSGGVEAAVHAARRLVVNLPHHHVVVKLDFSNAFNNVRRDLILDNIAAHTPEIYRLVHAAYSCEPILAFGEHQILSEEGAR